jgi:hypothetical protein
MRPVIRGPGGQVPRLVMVPLLRRPLCWWISRFARSSALAYCHLKNQNTENPLGRRFLGAARLSPGKIAHSAGNSRRPPTEAVPLCTRLQATPRSPARTCSLRPTPERTSERGIGERVRFPITEAFVVIPARSEADHPLRGGRENATAPHRARHKDETLNNRPSRPFSR